MEMGDPASPLGRNLQYPLNRSLGGPQSWSECFGEEKKLFSVPGIETQIVQSVAKSQYGLRYCTCWYSRKMQDL